MTKDLRQERGFTLIELLVASTLTVVVLGGAVSLTSQIQSGYRRQIEDSVGEQEARYALDWIGRYLRSAGNNPFLVSTSACPSANTAFVGIIMDPDGNGVQNDITIQSDTNPPDGKIGGEAGTCSQKNEHVTIQFDSANKTITFLDNAVGPSATTTTDSVIESLQFVYLRNTDSTDPNQVVTDPDDADDVQFVRTFITIRTRTRPDGSSVPRTLMSETRVRNR
jgi:prepilin-type N-terminal cleavage/methylation domain-containing protein